MSTDLQVNVEDERDPNFVQRNVRQEFRFQIGRIFGIDKPQPPPPRPVPPAAPPQTLDQARSVLATLRTAGSAVRSRILADPDLGHRPDLYAPGAAKAFLSRWQADVENVLREAISGEALTVIADVGRADRALNGIFGDDRPGAIARQSRTVADLESKAVLDGYVEAGADLRKMDLAIAKTLLKLRDLWLARVSAAEKIPRPQGVPTRPILRGVMGDVNAVVQSVRNVTDPESCL
jgi:hypothetical protein